MIKKTILTLCISTISVVGFAQTKKAAAVKPVAAVKPLTSVDSASYSFGLKIAMGLKSDGVGSLNYALLSKAMEDVFMGNQLMISDEQAGAAISGFLQQASKAKFSGLEEEGSKFLAQNKLKPNIITTASGLQYEVITQGTGEKPKATDEVTVHYKGTLINGNQFDSSYDRNEPLSLPLNNVIPGWTEGVQLMAVGSKYRFYIPYQLGYGERGAGQDIPPFSTLLFDIELIKIGK
ncbi:FKBP-type peptidyl-prolyl cis-trans isomerase [Pedobacter cryophilus]|uniref:Peptidyl-prolyl cis-trans isomerase n=1 Tax=Pedobacter cryophilus TaxID=2571271 RepID=A0A4U1C1Q7_9SPHI|nr:FKBP-type peptidyl-prolyl cis-trans isomerase [Pedobacter cryophilus]TKB97833.1 FKBP-type peptidyl-prolyl cis-trans isomerase [Pedobacter cryophilus]